MLLNEEACHPGLSDEAARRLAIIRLLKEGELCVCEIMTALDRPQSSTSHHLSILKDARLIKERKDGKWSRYRMADGAVVEMMNLAELMR